MRAALALAAALAVAAVVSAASAFSSGGDRTMEITIHHSAFSVSHLSFPAGTTVRFVIRNTDPIEHEFILGDRAEQNYIESHAHPTHDGSVPGQISVPAGTVRVTTYTFGRPGNGLLFGCHLPGHYAYGMRGTVTVT